MCEQHTNPYAELSTYAAYWDLLGRRPPQPPSVPTAVSETDGTHSGHIERYREALEAIVTLDTLEENEAAAENPLLYRRAFWTAADLARKALE